MRGVNVLQPTRSAMEAVKAAGFDVLRTTIHCDHGILSDGTLFDVRRLATDAAVVGLKLILVVGPMRVDAAGNWLPINADDLARLCPALSLSAKACPGAVWQLGNEPNTPKFGGYLAGDYARFVVAASAAIKAADPTATVVSAGLAEPGDLAFLENVFPSIASSIDGVGAHQYGALTPEVLVSRKLAPYRQLVGNKPVHVTEVGWTETGATGVVDALRSGCPMPNLAAVPVDQWSGYWVRPGLTRCADPWGGTTAYRLSPTDAGPDGTQGGLYLKGSLDPAKLYAASVWIRTPGAPFEVFVGTDDQNKHAELVTGDWRAVTHCGRPLGSRVFQIMEATKANGPIEICAPETTLLAASPLDLQRHRMGLRSDYGVRAFAALEKAGAASVSLFAWDDPAFGVGASVMPTVSFSANQQ